MHIFQSLPIGSRIAKIQDCRLPVAIGCCWPFKHNTTVTNDFCVGGPSRSGLTNPHKSKQLVCWQPASVKWKQLVGTGRDLLSFRAVNKVQLATDGYAPYMVILAIELH